MAELWDGLVMMALGVGASLVGQRLRYQYRREFDALREDQDPVYAMNVSLMRRGAAVFLTAGALLGIFGAFFAASGAWHLLRGQ
jgi:ABC-type branched-subunit amino acid transport system permease subunit